MLSGITGAFHALPKAWFWGEKSLGSIKNSNRLLRKSVRTRQNRRRLSDSDFHCVFDAKRCGKPWKHGIFGGLSSAVIFRQIPPSSVLLTWLEMQLSARARGFESHRFRHQSLENSMFSRLFLLFGQHLFWEKQLKWCPELLKSYEKQRGAIKSCCRYRSISLLFFFAFFNVSFSIMLKLCFC